MADISMPRLSDSMEEGTILKWLKSDGDEVAKGEELAEIETDKANMTYESDTAGTLTIVAAEGDTLAVGETIARIGEASEIGTDHDDDDEDAADAEEPGEGGGPGDDDDEDEADGDDDSAEDPDRLKASPVARRMAREIGLELSSLEGTGPGGRIVKADVEAATRDDEAGSEDEAPEPEPEASTTPTAESDQRDKPAAKGEVTHQELSKLQQIVARRMAESKATAPDFILNGEIEMDAAVKLRSELKEMAISAERPSPSVNDMVIKACALALREFPKANGAYRDGQFELYSRVNVGIAVSGQDALVVPTVYDADRKSLGEIARDSHELAARVRSKEITPPELSGGTFTVSNLGMYGIKSFTAVINPPQAAILAVGALTERAVVRDGALTTRLMMDVTLSCDHRILYGADAAEFLARIRELLEQPLAMSL